MQSLISSMLQGGNPLTVGVGIVIEVIRKNNSDYDPENGHNPDAPPTSHDPIYLGTLLRMFAKHVPDFMELILSSKHTVTEGDKTVFVERQKLHSAWGTQIEPLGFDRFKTCELMAELLHCSNMGLLNEKGSEEFIQQRDAERERLRAQGVFAPQKEEDSAVDISEDSSRFANGLNSSLGASPDDLRITNSSEEDGFERVVAPDVSGVSEKTGHDRGSTSSTDAFTEIQERSKIALGDDFIDEPLSSPKFGTMSQNVVAADVPSPLKLRGLDGSSPTTANLEENVRRVSLEDTTMTSPPNEEDIPMNKVNTSPSSQHLPADAQSPGGISPHPDDTPAPLFSKSSDPNKTPTPQSPNPPGSPEASRDSIDEVSSSTQQEANVPIHMEEDSQNPETHTDTDVDSKPVVGDYLKIMFVENKVVPTILVSRRTNRLLYQLLILSPELLLQISLEQLLA